MSRWTTQAPRAVTALAALLAAAALVAAVVQGVAWARATPRADAGVASVRDEVAREASTAARTLTTLDAADAEASVAAWRAVSTGRLLATVSAAEGRQYRDLVAAGGANATSTVVETAVRTIDGDEATVLVGLDIAVDGADDPAGGDDVQRSRLVVTMTRTEDGWRASALAPVGVGS